MNTQTSPLRDGRAGSGNLPRDTRPAPGVPTFTQLSLRKICPSLGPLSVGPGSERDEAQRSREPAGRAGPAGGPGSARPGHSEAEHRLPREEGRGASQRGPRRRGGGGPGPCSHHPLPRSGNILCPRGRVRGAECPRERYLVRPPSANTQARRSAAGAAMAAQPRPAAMAEVRPRPHRAAPGGTGALQGQRSACGALPRTKHGAAARSWGPSQREVIK